MLIRCLRSLLRLFCRLAFRVELRGHRLSPHPGPLLVVANHESLLDGLLLALFLPFQPTWVVHTTVLRHPGFRALLACVPHLAVDPRQPMAMKQVVRLLQAGQPVAIFPEGRISVTGGLMKLYDGPAFAAEHAGVPVLPVRIEGSGDSLFARRRPGAPRRWFPRIRLTALPPQPLPVGDDPSPRARRQVAARALRDRLQDMLWRTAPDTTLFGAFLAGLQRHGRRHPLLMDQQLAEWNYGDVLTRVLALGRLGARLSAPGEAVGLLLPNISVTVCLIFGLSAHGRVAAMLNYTAGPAGVRSACATARVRTVITARAFIAQAGLQDLLAALSDCEVVYLEDLRARFSLRDKLWLFGWARWRPLRALPPGDPGAPAAILFTSGSEGRPKGVVHSHRSLLANIAQVRAVIDLSPADRFLMVLPLFHAFGFTCGALMPLVSGARVLLHTSPLHYRQIPELAYEHDCTVLFGTSTFLGHYARHAHPYDFRSLRYVVAGAERLSEAVRDLWLQKFGLRILEGYGATECGPVLAVNTPIDCRAGSVGRLLPGLSARLAPVEGLSDAAALSVRGPNLMLGYLLPEAPGQRVPLADGWYATGDLARIDADGFLYLAGRLKRFAKVAGEMVGLDACERLAAHAAPLDQHAAIALPDPGRGERIVLATTRAGLNRATLAAAAQALGLPELTLPRDIHRVDALPLLGSGKVDYPALHTMLQEKSGTS